MADIQLHTHTQDIEITAPQTKEVVIGSPMDKGGVLSITKNGKYVVSDYDLAEVEVLPAVSNIKVTENGTYMPNDYDVDAFKKVEVQVDDTLRVMTEFIKDGGKFGYAKMPNFDLIKLVAPYVVNGTNMFLSGGSADTNDIELTFPELTIGSQMFSYFDYSPHNSRNNAIINCHKLENATAMFYVSVLGSHTTVNTTSALKTIGTMFTYNYWMYTAEISDATGVDSAITCNGNRYMTNYRVNGYGKGFTKAQTVTYKDCAKFTAEGLLDAVDSFYDITKNEKATGSIIKVDSTLYNSLTDDQKKKITDKGWIITA